MYCIQLHTRMPSGGIQTEFEDLRKERRRKAAQITEKP